MSTGCDKFKQCVIFFPSLETKKYKSKSKQNILHFTYYLFTDYFIFCEVLTPLFRWYYSIRVLYDRTFPESPWSHTCRRTHELRHSRGSPRLWPWWSDVNFTTTDGTVFSPHSSTPGGWRTTRVQHVQQGNKHWHHSDKVIYQSWR